MGECILGGASSDALGFLYLYTIMDFEVNNYYCSQLIQSTDANTPLIRLTFSTLDLEVGDPCPDSLSVYDGPDNSAPLIGTFCGSDAPEPILSSGPDLFIEYQSDPDEESEFWIDWIFVGCDPPCLQGTCVNDEGDAACLCDAGFSGVACEVEGAENMACKCSVVPPMRMDCLTSFAGIKKDECILEPNCCWEKRSQNYYCYEGMGPDMAVPAEPAGCFPRPSNALRMNCGWKGITKDQCLCRGCCYDRDTTCNWCYDPVE